MKRILQLLFLLLPLFAVSQSSSSFLAELSSLKQQRMTAEKKVLKNENNPVRRQALLANIVAEYQKKENALRSKYNRIEQAEANSINQTEQRSSYNRQDNYSASRERKKQAAATARNRLGNISDGLLVLAEIKAQNDLKNRRTAANNFIDVNINKVEKVINFYTLIPPSAFDKKLDGLYNAHIIRDSKFSFSQNREIPIEIPCVVNVTDNKVIDVYPYGKKEYKINYATEYPNTSNEIVNGMVRHANYQTLEAETIVFIEPYMSQNPTKCEIGQGGMSYVSVWSRKKKYEGKTVYVYEYDKRRNLVNETPVKIVRAKNEKELEYMDAPKVPVTIGNRLKYFCEPNSRDFQVYATVSKSSTKPYRKDGKIKYVKISRYR